MFSKQSKYQQAVRLAVKAWMIFVEAGSLACKRAYERMMKLARSLRVPSGPARAQLWVDCDCSLRSQEIGAKHLADSVLWLG